MHCLEDSFVNLCSRRDSIIHVEPRMKPLQDCCESSDVIRVIVRRNNGVDFGDSQPVQRFRNLVSVMTRGWK